MICLNQVSKVKMVNDWKFVKMWRIDVAWTKCFALFQKTSAHGSLAVKRPLCICNSFVSPYPPELKESIVIYASLSCWCYNKWKWKLVSQLREHLRSIITNYMFCQSYNVFQELRVKEIMWRIKVSPLPESNQWQFDICYETATVERSTNWAKKRWTFVTNWLT